MNGLYVVPVAAVNDPVAPPPATIALVTPLTNVCVDVPGESAKELAPNFLWYVLSDAPATNVAV